MEFWVIVYSVGGLLMLGLLYVFLWGQLVEKPPSEKRRNKSKLASEVNYDNRETDNKETS